MHISISNSMNTSVCHNSLAWYHNINVLSLFYQLNLFVSSYVHTISQKNHEKIDGCQGIKGSGRCGLATAATWHTMSIAASGGVPWSGDRDFWGSVDPWIRAPCRLSHRIVNTCHGLWWIYPLVNIQIAIQNGDYSGFSR
jgi:hypothetical protein